MFCWLVGVVIAGSGVWQDCHSLSTCTLHQADPHAGRKTTMPMIPFSPWLHSLVNWRFSLTHRRFVCSPSYTQGVQRVFLTQSWVKKGCDFLFGGSFSLFLGIASLRNVLPPASAEHGGSCCIIGLCIVPSMTMNRGCSFLCEMFSSCSHREAMTYLLHCRLCKVVGASILSSHNCCLWFLHWTLAVVLLTLFVGLHIPLCFGLL